MSQSRKNKFKILLRFYVTVGILYIVHWIINVSQDQCIPVSVYQCIKSSFEKPNIKLFYICSIKNNFKIMWSQNLSSFKNNVHRIQTSLSTYIWNLKEGKKTPTVKWKILKDKTKTFRSLNDPCHFSLHEKLYIKFLNINVY